MSLKKGTPGKGGKGRVDSFSYTPVHHGLKNTFGAWMAGEPYWCLAHEHTKTTPGTKPCLQWMTDGAIHCPRCRPHTEPVWIGYVPLYRETDHKPILVLVHESAMDLLTGLDYPAHVLVGRVDENSSVFVKKSDNALSFRTDNEQRKRPRCLTPDLLTMWGIPALEQWIMEHERKPKAPPLTSSGEPFGPMTSSAAQKYGGGSDQARAVDAEYSAPLNRVKKFVADKEAQTNGKHKPK